MAFAATARRQSANAQPSFLAGAGNIFAKELTEWLRTRRFLISTVLMTLMAGAIPVVSFITDGGLRHGPQEHTLDVYQGMLGFWLQLAMSLGAYTAAALTMGILAKEEETGTAQWLFTKPLSRSGYVLAKFAANGLAVAASTVVIPFLTLLALIFATGGIPDWSIIPVTLAITSFHAVVTVAMVIGLSAFFQSGAPIAGIAVGLNFIPMLIMESVTFKVMGLFPVAMVLPATNAISGLSPEPFQPMIAGFFVAAGCLAVACYRVSRRQLQ